MADFATSHDAAVQAQLDRLAALSPGGDQLGLERISALLERLGRPQDRLPPVFHVAGTNGKGSTCAFLRSALEAAGHSVHVFTSPHLVRFNERIRLAGKLIEDKHLASLLGRVLDTGGDIGASFFEVTTAAAFLAFAEAPADACVIEVGLGGRLDATNVIEQPLVCGIASLGIDHEAFLLAEEQGTPSEPLSRIGFEKAGIAKRGVPLVIQRYPPPVEATIAAVADQVGAALLIEGRDWHVDPALQPILSGPHQRSNASLAAAMIGAQDKLCVSADAIRNGVASASWAARFQRLGDGQTWVDGAHNPAAAALAATLPEPMHIVLGILANKDAAGIVDALRPRALSLTFVPVTGHAHHDPAELAARYDGHAASSVEEALAALPGPRLVAGSLYLAGQLLAAAGELPD